MLDINVLLDVLQRRQPHCEHAAAVLSAARSGKFEAMIPAHALTTLFYLVERANDARTANQTVDWLLEHFEIPPLGKDVFRRARSLGLADFEDAVVAAIAQGQACDRIVSRNGADFQGCPVAVVGPAEFLQEIQNLQRETGSQT